MRKLLLATTAVALSAGAVSAEDIKIGVILGFTGPIESLTPQMCAAAEMAMAEATASGALLGGSVGAHDAFDTIGGDQTLGNSCRCARINTGRVAAHRGYG